MKLAAVAVAAAGLFIAAVRGQQKQAELIGLRMQLLSDQLMYGVQSSEWMRGVPDDQRLTTDDFPPKRRYPVHPG